MTALESRFRRLLAAAYPADHRQAYEREMLGVLMSGRGARRSWRSPATRSARSSPGEAVSGGETEVM